MFSLCIHKLDYYESYFKPDSCDKVRFFSRPSITCTMSKTKVLNIRIDPELKKKAKKLAEADGRSLSNWVTHLITKTVKDAEKKDSA